ncbi:hypothetical protein PhCBS80983_g06206 [Powellomyces hirtus]|uniref:Band 7 domain-containing protein n=1 Tax=Powellomyces hirtus TaxID=109895 RepID=A0A507DR54_9FUNG|nr:hypothetical protein PhCBS80983_g06206 [Powellomyces hirtus]
MQQPHSSSSEKRPIRVTDEPQGTPPPMFPLQKSFAAEIPLPKEAYGAYESTMSFLGSVIGFFGAFPCCVLCPNPYKSVKQGDVGLVTRFGRYYKTIDPGLEFINPVTEKLTSLDVRVSVDLVPNQLAVSKDNCTISLDSVIYWEIIDPYTSAFGVTNVRQALIERTQTTLRQIVGSRTIQEVVEQREQIAHEIQSIVEGPASTWGVKVESILIKDIQFSKELQESLSMAAKQHRLAEAKIIQAKAEVESAKLMREASDILSTKAAMNIRYLETMQSMAKQSGTKVIFMPSNTSDMNKLANVETGFAS